MENVNDYYQTSDFCLSSYLIACNINPAEINTNSLGKATFFFHKTSQIESLIEQFSNLKASIEPLSFFSAQKKLKQLIYLKR